MFNLLWFVLLLILHSRCALARVSSQDRLRGRRAPDDGISQLIKARSGMVPRGEGEPHVITPKIIIIDLFAPEGAEWPTVLPLVKNVSLAGLSPLFPYAYCTPDYDICQIITGESEINAATSISALYLSPQFDLRKTYFLIAGIAGVNPYQGTTGTAAFARYAVQVALQFEIDAREIPSNWSTGYFPFGTFAPYEYPTIIYGTECFELNLALRDKALSLAAGVTLNDSSDAMAYRALYDYEPANQPPTVIAGDVAISDVFYSGHLLSEAFGNYTVLFTNGSGVYVTTAQEDNAVLEALLRGTLAGLVDFSRIVSLRTCSDFDRPPPGVDPVYHLTEAPQGGFEISLQNILLAGLPFVVDVVDNWDFYEKGIKPPNYIGDIFGTLAYLYGPPDIGSEANYITNPVTMR